MATQRAGIGGQAIDQYNNLLIAPGVLNPGEIPSYDRQAVWNGGVGITISATGVIKASPCGIIRLRCIVAGTITSIHDNASAASGQQILGSTAMTTASPPIEIGEDLVYGAYATIASGTFRVVFTPSV